MSTTDDAGQPSWQELREQMPATSRWAYFDHAAVAPMSGPAQKAIAEWNDDMAHNGSVNWSRWRRSVERCRKDGAQLIGADEDEVAVIRNTTEGINFVAEGYPWQAGDNVVTLDSEFPSNLYPWLHLADKGVEARVVQTQEERLDLDRINRACDSKTRIVSVSWVGYATGWRNDLASLAELVHESGTLLFVDAIQGLGVLPLDVGAVPIDFLAADGHKWMLGPEGAGLFFLRREHLDLLRPVGVGWNSVKHAGDFTNTSFDLKQTAARYEGGTHNLAGSVGFAASLEMLGRYGVNRVAERLLQVTDELVDGLKRTGARIASCREENHRSGIVAVDWPDKDPQSVRRACRDAGVIVNCRGGHVRLSPHAYTSKDDIEKLLDVVRSLD